VKPSTDRDAPQLFNVFEMNWGRDSERALLHGIDVRMVSEDPLNGSATFMAHFPAGWRVTEKAEDHHVEIFVLEGDMTADGTRVGAAGFVSVAHGRGPAELSSEGGAHAYVFLNAPGNDPGSHGDGTRAVKSWKLEWTAAPLPGSIHGRMYKPLRLPDPSTDQAHGGPDGILHLVEQVPGFHYPHLEYHHCSWEEMFVISGDNFMPERGLWGAGSYISNPAGFKHGMYMTQRGMYLLRHTTRPVDFESVPCEWGPEFVESYMDDCSLIEPPVLEDWADRPERQRLLDHPAYERP
jgi:hypothetical protein